MMRAVVRNLLLLVPLLWAGFAWGADPYITEPAPTIAFSELPANLSQSLDPQGVRLVSTQFNKQTAICDVWWHKAISARKATNKALDVAYDGINPGAFLGVISLLSYREDFQHHILKPGLYTMRYAQLQQDGDDHAVSPYRDFVVLSPGWSDKEPDTVVPLEELTKRGILASHQDEPAVLSLVPVNPAYKKFPAAVADDRGFCTLQIKLQQQLEGKTSDLPLAIIIVRPMWENEGS
jgi:hypothetical protein